MASSSDLKKDKIKNKFYYLTNKIYYFKTQKTRPSMKYFFSIIFTVVCSS